MAAALGSFFVLIIYYDQARFWQYLFILLFLTLVLVGVLRAVGAIQKPTIVLGGSIVVFAALWWITSDQFRQFDLTQNDREKLQSERDRLQQELNRVLAGLQQLNEKELLIVTVNLNDRPIRDVLVKYESDPDEKTARKEGHRHIIPIKQLANGGPIRLELDRTAPPERVETEAARYEIDRLIYLREQQQLRLFLQRVQS
ncbi:hypothetical protein AA309_05415 [Microvirga vignae]|uniref:Uncharacterized protein n=2 Tax=Microvirga vignae TaxID=1225564 RepID=A0A0H1RFE3_9HYPH|nr:hypothetical protein AA309_05415 [Microvirga vignae]